MATKLKSKERRNSYEERRLELQRLKELEDEKEANIKQERKEIKEQSFRHASIEETLEIFKDLLVKVREVKISTRSEDRWQKYLLCENQTDSKKPPDLRNFIYKCLHEYRENCDQTINWLLKCDERSMLEQRTDNLDLRRKKIDSLREPIGYYFDRKLQLMLEVYNSLCDKIRRKKVSQPTLDDLITIRDELRVLMFKFLDVFTFDVLMNIDREMFRESAIASNYSFVSPNFIKHLWTFKEVPLPKNYETIRTIKMKTLNMTVTSSSSVDLKNSSVRGMWFINDFLSDFAVTFAPLKVIEFQDLLKALDNEWMVRQEMKKKHLEEMQKTRLDYEVKMKQKLLEEEAKKGKPKDKVKIIEKPKLKSKTKDKFEIEPPIVDENTFIDVEEEYLAYEDDIALQERLLMGPAYLPLNENDINMRQYQISGGIFKIDLLQRPLQTEQINQHLFIRINEVPNRLKFEQFQHKYKPVTFVPTNDDRKSKLTSLAADKEEMALRNLFKVEIKLFDRCCWWENPVVCRWEPWEESEEFEMLDELTKDYNLHYEDHVAKEQQKLFINKEERLCPNVLTIEDFDLSNLPEDFQLSHLIQNYLNWMLPDNFKIFYEELETFEDKRKEWKKILQLEKEKKQELISESEDLPVLSDFLKNYNESHVTPKALFPKVGSVSLILEKNLKAEQDVENLRKWIKDQKTDEMRNEIDMGEAKPAYGAPLLLSELLEKINIVKASNKPFFKELSEIDKSMPMKQFSAPQTSDKPKSRQSTMNTDLIKSSRQSVRQSRMSRTSNSRSSLQSRKSSVSSFRQTKQLKIVENSSVKDPDHFIYRRENELKLIPHSKGKWRTKYIYNQSYDPETKVLTFYAGRLGTFGFATKKYYNCPFISWELLPFVENKNEKFVLFTLVAPKVKLEIKITDAGYTFKIKEPGKTPVQEIFTPVKVFELKKILISQNINIFPEVDAGCYVDNISEKHKPMEHHTYNCMAMFSLSHNFASSKWNRWAHRRTAIMKSRMIDKKVFKELMVTPLMAASVVVREKCTDLSVVELEYEMNPPDQEFFPDLMNLLKIEVDNTEHKVNQKSHMLIWFVQALLLNVQPLSFTK